METCIFKPGDIVEISNNLTLTENHYGVDREMRDMIGKKYKIEKVHGIKEVIIKRFTWHTGDLIPSALGEPIKVEVTTFDSNNLVL
jgi:hypothetical protein